MSRKSYRLSIGTKGDRLGRSKTYISNIPVNWGERKKEWPHFI